MNSLWSCVVCGLVDAVGVSGQLGSALKICLLREICAWILEQDAHKCIFWRGLCRCDAIQDLGATLSQAPRRHLRPVYHRVWADSAGQSPSVKEGGGRGAFSNKQKNFAEGESLFRRGRFNSGNSCWPSFRPG